MPTSLTWLDRTHLQALAVAAAPRALAALVALVLFWILLRLTRPLLQRLLLHAGFAGALVHLLVDGLYKGSIVILAIITAAGQLGMNVTAALAGLGVAGIALGFAAQETVANMIAGFLIFWDRPFKIGDYITTQSQYGRVQEITMRTTRVRTMENTYVVIPNRQIIGELLVNHSMYGELRINVAIGIAYKERIDQARAVLLAALAKVPEVLPNPAPDVVARALGSSSVDLHARLWIADASHERPVGYAALEACKIALDEAGIEIPYPHLQLFVEDVREKAVQGLARVPRLAAAGR